MKIRNIPFGYQMENGRITPHPAESETVREIFTAYLDGQSLLQIANSLNERNIEYMPGVTGWNKARLKRIIEDERYLGSESYPAMIGQADFSEAQKIKAERNTAPCADCTTAVLPIRKSGYAEAAAWQSRFRTINCLRRLRSVRMQSLPLRHSCTMNPHRRNGPPYPCGCETISGGCWIVRSLTKTV